MLGFFVFASPHPRHLDPYHLQLSSKSGICRPSNPKRMQCVPKRCSNSFVCHSYRNGGGVTKLFPNRKHPPLFFASEKINSFRFCSLRTLHTNRDAQNRSNPFSFNRFRTLAEMIGDVALSTAFPQPAFPVWTSPFPKVTLLPPSLHRGAFPRLRSGGSRSFKMAAVSPLPAKAADAKGLLYWMERVLEERERVMASPDEDSVHDLRVALRRCRSLASVFEEVDPHPAWRELRKTSKKLFRSLGVIRDAQVQEAWTLKLFAADDPLRGQILYAVKAGRVRQERDAKKSAAKFDVKGWVRLSRELRPRLRFLPADGDAALCLALERHSEAAELHRRALRTEKMKPWHQLRIGIKHFRYTVENLLPKLHAAWGSDLKRVQDLLGDVHDLDVLAETARSSATDANALAKWQETIAHERNQRIETYRQLALGTTSLWNQWRAGLPTNGRVAEVAEARLKATARAADPSFSKTASTARLARKLYKEFQRVKAINGTDLDTLLHAVALLHGIEPEGSHKSANKDARKLLAILPPPPGWTAESWQLLSLAVRYHRGAAPSPEKGVFANLEPAQQNKILLLAGILRVARGLRKTGVLPGAKVRVATKPDSVTISLEGFSEAQIAPKSLNVGRQLLESALGKSIAFRSLETLAPTLPLEFPANETKPFAVSAD